jgi:DNA-binding protein HU-beta
VTKTRAARDGRNPATGTMIKIPARTAAAFKPAAAMKDLK